MLSSELIEIAGPALVVGLLISLTHAPLGIEVLKRGIIFIDLAIAQIAGLGIIATQLLFHEPSPLIVQAIALSCAVLAGLFFRKAGASLPHRQEAIIGVGFILASSSALLMLADHPRGGEEIQHLLSGQMLFVTWENILMHLPVYILVLGLWFLRPRRRDSASFYLLFALAITSSVQLVGVYVVFASLILPALATSHLRSPLPRAWLCGILAVSCGVILSVVSDLPTGSMLVISYTLAALALYPWRRHLP